MSLAGFLRSYNDYGWYLYRDGFGYDLTELTDLTDEEIQQIEKLVIKKSHPDWPDVEVLAHLKTDKCIKFLKKWMNSSDMALSCHSMRALTKLNVVDDESVINKIRFWIPRAPGIGEMSLISRLVNSYSEVNFDKELMIAITKGRKDLVGFFAALLLFRNGIIENPDGYWKNGIVNNIHTFNWDRDKHSKYIKSLLESSGAGSKK